MNEPPSAPVHQGSSVLNRGLRAGRLASRQLVIQGLGAITGILLVRTLGKSEYAWLTIANSVTALFSVLVEGATGLGLQAIGSRIWKDRTAMSSLVSTALRLRWTLGGVAALVAVPFPLWLLLKNQCPPAYAIALVAVGLCGLPSLMTAGVLGGALKLLGHYRASLVGDLWAAATRLGGTVLALAGALNALSASLAASISLFVQHGFLKRASAAEVDSGSPPSAEWRGELLGQVRQLWPHSVFQYLQGQVSLWLISLHGAVAAVADFGALTRLMFIFSAFASLYYQLVIPWLSRSPTFAQTRRRVAISFAALAVLIAILTIAASLLSPFFLWILGPHYLHLGNEVPWMILLLGTATFSTVVWWFNTSRGWIRKAWMNPFATVIVQVLAVVAMRPASVLEIIHFSLLTFIPSLVLGLLMTVRGFRREDASAPPDAGAPDFPNP